MGLSGPYFNVDRDLTPDFLKVNYLTGLTLLGADNRELPRVFFQHHLDQAAAKLEEIAMICVTERTVTGEKHDFHITDYAAFGFVPLFLVPVLSVSEVRAVFPTGQTIQTFPSDWIRLETSRGQIQLVPVSGSLAQLQMGQGFDVVIFNSAKYLPHLWEVDYTAGFDQTQVPRTIVEAICKLAVIDILTIMNNTVQPIGIQSQSLGVDGLSESRSFEKPAFKAMLDRYTEDLYGNPSKPGSGLIAEIRNTYNGINFVSL
jgi:hypothetical protein